MSDGGRESGRDNQSDSRRSKLSGGSDEFGRAVSKIAVAQILETSGFQSANQSAIDALADVAIRYICDLGKAARFYANLSGRMSCNVFDVIQGLEDLTSSQGFSSASDVHHCLVSSGVIRDIASFISTGVEIPFARSIPKFPIARTIKSAPSFAEVGEAVGGKHIPEWLPAFPDPHTFVHTPVWNKRTTDPRADMIEQARQRRKAERSLLNLQQRLASNVPAGFTPFTEVDLEKGKQVVGSNPYLAPPLPYGDKEVSDVVMPSGSPSSKRPSVLETFAPAIEAAKGGVLSADDLENRVLPSQRPTVHFKFGIDKKSVTLPLSSSALDDKKGSWFLRDDERDDKKRRAEMILKEAMENPQELAQL